MIRWRARVAAPGRRSLWLALLFGLERGWSLERSVRLGNRIGAMKIACRGGQNHVVTPALAEAVTD